MIKRKSMFARILFPVIVIMIVQVVLMNLVIYMTGTVQDFGENSLYSLKKSSENRSITLENTMVHNWSNIDRLETALMLLTSEYREANDLTIDDLLSDKRYSETLLDTLSVSMIEMLRITSATGIFVYFLDGNGYQEQEVSYGGMYLRDLDPVTTPADDSDILMLKGSSRIAVKHNLPLDSLWQERFFFSPENALQWEIHEKPLRAALEHPELGAFDLSYWSRPHFSSDDIENDANSCITYTRPVIVDGEPIAIIGTEVQSDQLYHFFPANDFGTFLQGGYLLMQYSKTDDAPILDCHVNEVTGSYIKRLISPDSDIQLSATENKDTYTLADPNAEKIRIIISPLRLYNSNAPFSDQQWALAAVATEDSLYGDMNNLQLGILLSTMLPFLVGLLVLTVTTRIITKPLMEIVNQIGTNTDAQPLHVSNLNTYETELLFATLNDMITKTREMEQQLRGERERYLLALESATNIFVEYDIPSDTFMLYYFSKKGGQKELSSYTVECFSEKLMAGEICHANDSQKLMAFLTDASKSQIEVRLSETFLNDIVSDESDKGYHWFSLKVSHIQSEDGKAQKVIGVAKSNTADKLREKALLDLQRRDITTGYFKQEYGLQYMQKIAASVTQTSYAVFVMRIGHFARFETYYGRTFAALMLRQFSVKLKSLCGPNDVLVRLWNDEFVLLIPDMQWTVEHVAGLIHDAFFSAYFGENPEAALAMHIGVSLSKPEDDFFHTYHKALQALDTAVAEKLRWVDGTSADTPPQVRVESNDTPVSIDINVAKDSMVGLSFDLFEGSSDLSSMISMLLMTLGELYKLSQIIICSYDHDFGANQIYAQWCGEGAALFEERVEKVAREEYNAFLHLMHENRTLVYRHDQTEIPEAFMKMLCITGETGSSLCCLLLENGTHIGHIIFRAKEQNRDWKAADTINLYEITKIVSTHMIAEKSNSASRAKSEFLSRMSHEIRTPMNAIIGMTAMARNVSTEPEKVKRCLDSIDFSSKHLLSLINDVLNMSRIESGKMQLNMAPMSLDDFCTTLDTLMREAVEANGIEFEIRQYYFNDVVIGDEYRLRQVLVNLIGNANKFTKAGGKIIFSITEEDDESGQQSVYRFSVKDTGIGVHKDDQAKIFGAFEQVNTGSQRETGTGLGLSISSNIVGAMGGRIELESEVGVGSDFFFSLQFDVADERQVARQNDQPQKEYHFEGKRILVVDDNEINTEIAVFFLQEARFEVDTAENGLVATEKFFGSPIGHYDAILMDIQMPIMDGLTATRTIRKNSDRSDTADIPIIAMTADAFDEDMKLSIESGMNGHIAKPVDIEALYKMLDKLLVIDKKEGNT